MGTNSSEAIRNDIHRILGLLGWSERRMAREIYYACNEVDNEDEIRQFEEKIRKSLQRKTTKPETLSGYLSIIMKNQSVIDIDIVKLDYIPIAESDLNTDALEELKKISRELDKKLK